jgi:uncharacterized protein
VTDGASSSVVVDFARSAYARLRPVPVRDVRLSDDLWEPRRRITREKTLPSQYSHLEDSGCLDNFRLAAGKITGSFKGMYFSDSDLYKWLEAASWSRASNCDPELEAMIDAGIAEIEDAQRPDGYLNTFFAIEREGDRWTNLTALHELYCAGHLIQAAVAHRRATGSTRLLNVARRYADLICDVFGPEDEGKRAMTDGHEEIEMALVELWRATGERRYLEQAQFFIDVRGRGLVSGREYHQDHKPFREMDTIVGHAVRAVYLNAGVADLYAETGEQALVDALERLWDNVTTRRMYVTGGIGSRYDYEAFGKDFELPNERAYTETCAAIGSMMWNWRMLALDGEARYSDLIELTLYNAILPGVSLDGEAYFYQNPLADDGSHRRKPWFPCACCPPNLARLLASLPGYFYSTSEEGLWVHLYAQGSAEVSLGEGRRVGVTQRTDYPWDGEVDLDIDSEGEFTVYLRVPAWAEEGASIEVNGRPLDDSVGPGAYARISREWRRGDRVQLSLPMRPRRIECHPYVIENAGHVALMRGPILYCLEEADNPGLDVRDVILPAASGISAHRDQGLLGGVVTLGAAVEVKPPPDSWKGQLYRVAGSEGTRRQDGLGRREAVAIPYFTWANRGAGRMGVWLRTA